MHNPTDLNKEFARLSWKILEAKIMYYQPPVELHEYVEKHMPSDEVYDDMEIRYLTLCKELNKPNTLVHKHYHGLEVDGNGMMEVDWSRPSCSAALEKLYIKAGIPKEVRKSLYAVPEKKKKKAKKKSKK